MVCGVAEVDIKLLESVTEYSSCRSTDSHIILFWKVLSDFSNDEKAAFVRFVWGRSRLPLTASGFSQRFKIQSFPRSPPDSYLPVSHTCFFSLGISSLVIYCDISFLLFYITEVADILTYCIELPQYSSIEVMREKLRYAIFNCAAIDGDDTTAGIEAGNMQWEE